jgi:hypothetical protein
VDTGSFSACGPGQTPAVDGRATNLVVVGVAIAFGRRAGAATVAGLPQPADVRENEPDEMILETSYPDLFRTVLTGRDVADG